MADQTIEKTPMASTSVNQPESGTYGEGADLARLKQELPPLDRVGMGAATGGPAPMPQPDMALPGRPGGRPLNAPQGVPDVLLQPGEVPGGQMPGPTGPTVSPEAARISLLQQLAESPQVSEATREWARLVLEAILGS